MPLVPGRLRAPARLIAATVAAVLAAVLVPAQPAPAATGVTVSKYFFGMHDSNPISWPRTPVGSIRLWDAKVAWNQIETSPGVYDWTLLDSLVGTARAHHAEISLVLGQTPSFWVADPATVHPICSVAPTDPYCSRNGPGATSMPNIDAWKAYVSAVAARYKGRVASLQVWNEANVPGFWAGSAGQMAELTFVAKQAVAGTGIKLVSPGFVGRSNTTFISRYFASNPFGAGPVKNFFDKVALSLYPPAAGTPESSTETATSPLKVVKKILAKYKVTKPIWNTEINYGLAAGGTGVRPKAISTQRQAAYVVRTLLLDADARIERVFWYSWDLRSIGNTLMTSGAAQTPTAAGKAFGLTQSWLAGSRLTSCATHKRGALKGVYICTLKYKGGVKRVYWNPTKRVRVTMPSTATYRITLAGKKLKLKHSARLTVDYRPVLVRSKR
jgi:polysaccharide biosynthesis protein PslG